MYYTIFYTFSPIFLILCKIEGISGLFYTSNTTLKDTKSLVPIGLGLNESTDDVFIGDWGHNSLKKFSRGMQLSYSLPNIWFASSPFVYQDRIYLGSDRGIYMIPAARPLLYSLIAGYPSTKGIPVGYNDGFGTFARFQYCYGISVHNKKDIILVADRGNNAIRSVSFSGDTQTIAGGGTVLYTTQGFVNGIGTDARFNNPQGIAVDSDRDILFVTDSANNAIRLIYMYGQRSSLTYIGGNTIAGHADGVGTYAQLNNPYGITFNDIRGELFFTEPSLAIIRMVSLSTEKVTTIAGVANQGSNDDGIGSYTKFLNPRGIAVNRKTGVLYVLDLYFDNSGITLTSSIRKLMPSSYNPVPAPLISLYPTMAPATSGPTFPSFTCTFPGPACTIQICQGSTIHASSCSLEGGQCTNDPLATLIIPVLSAQVQSDDTCGYCPAITYTYTSAGCTSTTLTVGCINVACTATFAISGANVVPLFPTTSPTRSLAPTLVGPPTVSPNFIAVTVSNERGCYSTPLTNYNCSTSSYIINGYTCINNVCGIKASSCPGDSCALCARYYPNLCLDSATAACVTCSSSATFSPSPLTLVPSPKPSPPPSLKPTKSPNAVTSTPTGSSFTCPLYQLSLTNFATTNTISCTFKACDSAVRASSCPGSGGLCAGDTFIRLFKSDGTQVAVADDSCGHCSAVQYSTAPGACEILTLVQGCYSMFGCAGIFQVTGAVPYSVAPTATPTMSSPPSLAPSSLPTRAPSSFPTVVPSRPPTRVPTFIPTMMPSISPTSLPSSLPSLVPSLAPSIIPSYIPSGIPTYMPTIIPSRVPSVAPSEAPSDSTQPTYFPSSIPTLIPTTAPTLLTTTKPSQYPSLSPSIPPSFGPTISTSASPSLLPSLLIFPSSFLPTIAPSYVTQFPSPLQSSFPPQFGDTTAPSAAVSTILSSSYPSLEPSPIPSSLPTQSPSSSASVSPSVGPSLLPSRLGDTISPTTAPSSSYPSLEPLSSASVSPSVGPSLLPSRLGDTIAPSTFMSSDSPTISSLTILSPSWTPNIFPSEQISTVPSVYPSLNPSISPSKIGDTIIPSFNPSEQPTFPSSEPSGIPSIQPSAHPSRCPTSQPSRQPSSNPSQPTSLPSVNPSVPTSQPSSGPTSPTSQPSSEPTAPTSQPTRQPSKQPSSRPSTYPTYNANTLSRSGNLIYERFARKSLPLTFSNIGVVPRNSCLSMDLSLVLSAFPPSSIGDYISVNISSPGPPRIVGSSTSVVVRCPLQGFLAASICKPLQVACLANIDTTGYISNSRGGSIALSAAHSSVKIPSQGCSDSNNRLISSAFILRVQISWKSVCLKPLEITVSPMLAPYSLSPSPFNSFTTPLTRQSTSPVVRGTYPPSQLGETIAPVNPLPNASPISSNRPDMESQYVMPSEGVFSVAPSKNPGSESPSTFPVATGSPVADTQSNAPSSTGLGLGGILGLALGIAFILFLVLYLLWRRRSAEKEKEKDRQRDEKLALIQIKADIRLSKLGHPEQQQQQPQSDSTARPSTQPTQLLHGANQRQVAPAPLVSKIDNVFDEILADVVRERTHRQLVQYSSSDDDTLSLQDFMDMRRPQSLLPVSSEDETSLRDFIDKEYSNISRPGNFSPNNEISDSGFSGGEFDDIYDSFEEGPSDLVRKPSGSLRKQSTHSVGLFTLSSESDIDFDV